jgi:hypothetical protein
VGMTPLLSRENTLAFCWGGAPFACCWCCCAGTAAAAGWGWSV